MRTCFSKVERKHLSLSFIGAYKAYDVVPAFNFKETSSSVDYDGRSG